MVKRPVLVVLGLVLVVVGLFGLFRGLTRATAPYAPPAASPAEPADTPVTVERQPQEGETVAGGAGWALAGGLLLAAGGAAIGIGVGRWGHARPPHSEADFTGPGSVSDHKRTPPVV